MASLVLVRHGQSEWNEKNLFTGWKDPDLTDKGEKEALIAGRALKASGYKFDIMFTSVLLRAKRTGSIILQAIIGFLAASVTAISIYWSKFKSLISRIFNKKEIEKDKSNSDD